MVDSRTQDFIQYLKSPKFDTLPGKTLSDAKDHILDTLGVALASSRMNAELYRRLLDRVSLEESSSAIGSPAKTSAEAATFLNSFLAHSLEMDDEHRRSMTHIGAGVVISSIAASELLREKGRELIKAVVIGYEVASRIGESLDPVAVYNRGFHPSCIAIPFGTCASTMSLMRLDETQWNNGFGLAAVQCSGLMAGVDKGPTSWYLQYAKAAQSGVNAAINAADGFVGPQEIFDNEADFFNAYSSSPLPDRLLEGLEDGFKLSESGIKPYPCCRSIHPGLDCLKEIIKTEGLQLEDIAEISFAVPPSVLPLVTNEDYRENQLSAQTSAEYCFALFLKEGKVVPEGFTQEHLSDLLISKIASKVKVKSDITLERDLPEKMPGVVEVRTKDNRRFMMRVDYPKGDPENPLSRDEITSKFRDINAPYNKQDLDQLECFIADLDSKTSVDELTSILRKI